MSIELEKTADDPERDKKATALAPGTQLGKYRLERILGEGGMGVVWAAKDPDLQRSIAIKVIKYANASPQIRQRLLREAVAMAKLKHPNVLTVYEVGTVGDRDYIAMEHVDGTTLDAWLAMGHPVETVWTALIAAGRGLAAAHDAGVVHRDFKPHNVLRSRDGRVLVTDFGLARGVLEEHEANAESEPAADSVLDTKLTQTGALIGTPAYMAPEQFLGSAPDPRTDQFAYCVTVWQALTGDRPFKGKTLEEMKRAVSSGVAHLSAKLPGAVRTVLTRGLDPLPANRWPSLDALLDALDRAARLPERRRLAITLGSIAVMLALGVAFVLTRRPVTVANACDAPEREFDEAWSPTVRSVLARKASGSAFERTAATFDQFRERWIASYQKTCRTRTARVFPERIACLGGVRDQIASLTYMLGQAPPEIYDRVDVHGILPNLGGCERAQPERPSTIPKQEPLRTQVLSFIARSYGLFAAPPEQLEGVIGKLETEAATIPWPSLLPTITVVSGHAYMRAGMLEKARETYLRAKKLVDVLGDHRLQAETYVGLLEVATQALAQPGTHPLTRLDDPRVAPVLHPELANALQIARDAAKDDPMLAGAIETMAALIYQPLAQRNRYASAYVEALSHAQEARKFFDVTNDARRATQTAALEAGIYLERGDDRALDDAFFTSRRAADALAAATLPPSRGLDEVRIEIAFLRGQYNEAHRLIAQHSPLATSPVTATIKGSVSPPGRATVIAWKGDLVGDPRRGYLWPDAPAMDVVQTGDDGTFTLHAEPGWSVLAEGADQRSLPQVIGSAPLALGLKPTVTLSGTVAGKNLFGIRAFARFKVGTGSWTLEVPVASDGVYDLRGLPPGGEPGFGTRGEQREVTAVGKQLTWPSGQSLEVIVRSPALAQATEVVVTSGEHDRAVAPLRRVGASATDAGRALYRPGDRHAVIAGNANGKVTACVGKTCKTVELQPSVMIEYPDGRFAAGVTPIVLDP